MLWRLALSHRVAQQSVGAWSRGAGQAAARGVSAATRVACLSGVGWAVASRLRVARCDAGMMEDPWLLTAQERAVSARPFLVEACCRVWHTFRIVIRCISLFFRLVPIAIAYPLCSRVERLNETWWRVFLYAVQTSGPTFLKLGQWASTRRDVFSKSFCDRISILHTKTKKHSDFKNCHKVLDDLFGKDFVKKHGKKVFVRVEPRSIGSGCIAQVYKATVDVDELERATGRKFDKLHAKKHADIAIKIAEPDVDRQIEIDLRILRTGAWMLQRVMPSIRYVDPMGALDQFEMVLRRQVDLRNEARALEKFALNFDASRTGVKFPKVLAYNQHAIVESFERGDTINRLVTKTDVGDDEKLDEIDNMSARSVSVRRRIALIGARALLKMIFVDNFVHGDLHPGNILIRFNDNDDMAEGVYHAPPHVSLARRTCEFVRSALSLRAAPRFAFTQSEETADEPTLVLLDTGIAISETDKNLANLRGLFRAVVEKKGYDAGRLILSQSPDQQCANPELFCREVGKLVDEARAEKSLRTLNISGLLSRLFSLVSEHRVSLDSSFTSVILSVMVLEGFGRSLDPDLDLFQCARPYLLHALLP